MEILAQVAAGGLLAGACPDGECQLAAVDGVAVFQHQIGEQGAGGGRA